LPIADAALAKLATLRILEVLDLSETRITELTSIEPLERLTMLAAAQTRIADTKPLAKLKNLRYLDLSSTPIDSAALVHLAALPLRSLYLSLTSVDDLSALASLNQLGTLAIDHVAFKNAPFAALTELHTLNADNSDLHDADLDALPLGTRVLHVARTQVSAAGLARLQRLLELQTLDVSGLPLDESVLLAWHFEHLRVLNVSQTPLKKLTPLPRSLQRLYLVDTAIGDSDLPRRDTLPKLERIDVRGTRVSQAALDAWLAR
jgi:Leucine-rich repeat (LRR) protein